MAALFRWKRIRRWPVGMLAALILVLIAYLTFIRPWHLHWGATEEEVNRSMPGDSFGIGAGPKFYGTTRLIQRLRAHYNWSSPGRAMFAIALDVGDFIMIGGLI
ncbi:hypothetical protein EHM92_00795 [bacterium]|nr:MAG: hypothetical protein EHM92_00795 [bacterium]